MTEPGAEPLRKRRPAFGAAARVTAALALGLGGGIAAAGAAPGSWIAGLVGLLEAVGTLWFNAIRMPALLLIVALLISTVAAAEDVRRLGRLGRRAFLLFFVLLLAAAGASTLAGSWLMDRLELDPARAAALRAAADLDAAAVPGTLREAFLSLVPANPVKAAADGALLPLIVFSLFCGFAFTRLDREARELQVRFFRGLTDALLQVVRWVLLFAPLGVFALAFALGARLGLSALGAIGYYVAVLVGLLIAAGLLLALLGTVGGRASWRSWSRALLPGLAVAFSTRSSLAALPALLEGSRRDLRLPEAAAGFVLPLAAGTFKLAAAVAWPVGALFVGRLYGIELGPAQLAVLALGTVLLSASTLGVPSGGFLVQAPLYAAVGLPAEGLGVLLAIDTVPDLFRTAVNVTGYLSTASLLAAREDGRSERGEGA